MMTRMALVSQLPFNILIILSFICLSTTLLTSYAARTPTSTHIDIRYGVKLASSHRGVRLVNQPKDDASSFSTLSLQSLGLPSFEFMHNDQQVDKGEWIMTVKSPISDLMHQSLSQSVSSIGGEMSHYMPHDSFLIIGASHANKEFESSLSSIPGVLSVQPFTAVSKVCPSLSNMIVESITPAPVMRVMADTSDSTTANVKNDIHHLRVHVSGANADLVKLNQWTKGMRLDGFVQTKLSLLNNRYIDLKVATSELPRAVAWLASRYDVHYMEQTVRFDTQNKFAQAVVQDNGKSGNKTALIWNHNLNGQGQVISCGDTGVDYDSCFFHDPLYPVPVGTTPNMKHRKIVLYVPLGDASDQAMGHGTHVAGTLVGEVTSDKAAYSALGPYNGVAYKSKLAFWDFKSAASDGLLVPDDLYNDYFAKAEALTGSAISSNSWGASPPAQYTQYCADTDRFVNEHQGFLPVFAAGNYGSSGIYTIATPGNAKNVLTVGASLSSSDSFFALGQSVGIKVVSPSASAGTFQVVPAGFGSPYHTMKLPDGTPFVLAQPFDGCSPLANADALKGRVAVFMRGTCLFSQKAERAQAAGAALFICVNNVPGEAIPMGGDGKTFTIPSGMITLQDWNFINVTSTAAQSPILVNAPVGFDAPTLNQYNMASFSSQGPTIDGRLKPDILAPGQFVMSSRSDGNIRSLQCDASDLLPMQGTSMATPVTAGAVSLVRQYYMDGYYPGGAPSASGLTPSAALLKATIIATGESLGGKVTQLTPKGIAEVEVLAAPSIHQGFGRVRLDRALAFADSMECDRPSLFVKDYVSIRASEVQSYCFMARPVMNHPYPLRATLVWSDVAGSSASAYQLINDLDLIVVNNDTKQLVFGNNHYFHDIDGDHWPTDDMNNVEQITVNSTNVQRETVFSVHVRGTNVPKGPQNFALVVNGFFRELPLDMCAGLLICPNSCSGHGTCNATTGLCDCNSGRVGVDCSQVPTSFERSTKPGEIVRTPVDISVPVGGWEYMEFTVEKWMLNTTTGLTLTMTRTSGKGDPDMYVTVNGAYPSFARWDYQAIGCDSCAATVPSTVDIPNDVVQKYPVIRVGIQGYCCESSTVSVIVTPAVPKPKPDVDEPTSKGLVAGLAILFTLGIAFGGWGIVWCRRRRQASSSQGYTPPGVPPTGGFAPLNESGINA